MKRISVVTGSRADYGLLYWTMKAIQAKPDLHLQTVVTGSHLSNDFGGTVQFIETDGFTISARIDCLPEEDSSSAIAKSIGNAIVGFSECFSILKPDCILVLGDRYEIYAAVSAAMILRIPIVHLHGGEITAGAIDDVIRHAISKMAHLHFVAAREYRNRLVQMGEAPRNIHVVGTVGLEWLHAQPLPSQYEVERVSGLPFGEQNIVVVFHPETLRADHGMELLASMLEALRNIPANLYCSGSNADAMGKSMTAMIQRFAKEKPASRVFFESLGHRNFLGLLKYADLIIGNSSCGILEAPALDTMTLNLGGRQEGRLMADSINEISGSPSHTEIHDCVVRMLAHPAKATKMPYGDGRGASRLIVDALSRADFDSLLHKRFHDR